MTGWALALFAAMLAAPFAPSGEEVFSAVLGLLAGVLILVAAVAVFWLVSQVFLALLGAAALGWVGHLVGRELRWLYAARRRAAVSR